MTHLYLKRFVTLNFLEGIHRDDGSFFYRFIVELSQPVAHFHESTAKQILAFPTLNTYGHCGFSVKTDAPYPVVGAGFCEHSITCGEQEIPQSWILAELCLVSLHNDGRLDVIPPILLESPNQTAKLLHVVGIVGSHDLVQNKSKRKRASQSRPPSPPAPTIGFYNGLKTTDTRWCCSISG